MQSCKFGWFFFSFVLLVNLFRDLCGKSSYFFLVPFCGVVYMMVRKMSANIFHFSKSENRRTLKLYEAKKSDQEKYHMKTRRKIATIFVTHTINFSAFFKRFFFMWRISLIFTRTTDMTAKKSRTKIDLSFLVCGVGKSNVLHLHFLF